MCYEKNIINRAKLNTEIQIQIITVAGFLCGRISESGGFLRTDTEIEAGRLLCDRKSAQTTRTPSPKFNELLIQESGIRLNSLNLFLWNNGARNQDLCNLKVILVYFYRTRYNGDFRGILFIVNKLPPVTWSIGVSTRCPE